ncbi:ABC transporter substrate-binding protein [Klebsiella pneumoniae]|nr:ABC transporter substrate-binding protein [Klebsiella pneumoniae]
MKKVLCALGLMFTAVSSALATTYPLTIENCGYQETFTRPPERVVALGQKYGRNSAAARAAKAGGRQRLLADQRFTAAG